MTDKTTPGVTAASSSGRTSEKTRVRLSDLRSHPRNPRTITPARLEQLQRTLAAEPDLLDARPLIALPDGTVVAGNQRLAAAIALGWETIPVVYADLSPEEVTRWMLLDNRGFGEDDRDAVAALLGELEAADSNLDLTGYEATDLDAMLRELHRPAADPDEVPPVPVVARSVLGEVYELGPHRLMCGDACDEAAVRALVGSCTPEVLWTDPPYGVSYVGHYRHEPILYGWKPGKGRAGRGAHEGSRWYGGNSQTSVFEYPKPSRSSEHPTMKPVGLIEAHLVNSSRLSDGVLDLFGGSGSTLIACEALSRRAFVMELDPAYCDVIRRRYADFVDNPSFAP